MQALLDAIATMPLPTDAQRVFHGRGGLFPGCEQWVLDAYSPVLVLTSFAPASEAELETIGAALQVRWSQIAPAGEPLNWVFQHRGEALRKGQGYFTRNGKTMDDFRAAVRQVLKDEWAAPAELPRSVHRGDTGSVVRKLQIALNKLGYGLEVDGAFGAKTEKAVRAYQKKAHLLVDGIVGPQTWAALLK